ncbi:MAG TPA: MarR family transcriptional regulator [Candidatus Micrarchaeaceae archaeon]|nr:MarR family transcriptional regulator [Candidatus Micrarchaeaceae archaeon]
MHEPFIESDANGCLFDRRIRERLKLGTSLDEVDTTEALAALRTASHALHNAMDRWLERHGLSESRMGVLWRLRDKDSITLGDLAQELDVSPRNITGLIDHLEADGFVERLPDPEDRRAIRVRLAAPGKQKLSDIKTEMGGQQHGLVANFTNDELQQLRHLCLKLARNLTATKELEKV